MFIEKTLAQCGRQRRSTSKTPPTLLNYKINLKIKNMIVYQNRIKNVLQNQISWHTTWRNKNYYAINKMKWFCAKFCSLTILLSLNHVDIVLNTYRSRSKFSRVKPSMRLFVYTSPEMSSKLSTQEKFKHVKKWNNKQNNWKIERICFKFLSNDM